MLIKLKLCFCLYVSTGCWVGQGDVYNQHLLVQSCNCHLPPSFGRSVLVSRLCRLAKWNSHWCRRQISSSLTTSVKCGKLLFHADKSLIFLNLFRLGGVAITLAGVNSVWGRGALGWGIAWIGFWNQSKSWGRNFNWGLMRHSLWLVVGSWKWQTRHYHLLCKSATKEGKIWTPAVKCFPAAHEKQNVFNWTVSHSILKHVMLKIKLQRDSTHYCSRVQWTSCCAGK